MELGGLKNTLLSLEPGTYELAHVSDMPLPTRIVDGTFRFRPVAYLQGDDVIVANYTDDLDDPVCWGYCETEEEPQYDESCAFYPYTPEAARVCKDSMDKGLRLWTITGSDGDKYTVRRHEDGTFTETNQSNRTVIQSVLRVDITTAKRMVVERILKERLGDKPYLLDPIFNSASWNDADFPANEYDSLMIKDKVYGTSYRYILSQANDVKGEIPPIEVDGLRAKTLYALLYEIQPHKGAIETSRVRLVD